jgi:3-phosphoshikimate 1-carboxyvinyltransferase
MFETEFVSRGTEIPSITLPASKSQSNRALILDFLYPGRKQLAALSSATDTLELRKAIYVLKNAGREIVDIYAGQGGTSFRFLMAALAVSPGRYWLSAHPQVINRPWQELRDALVLLGADIQYVEGEKPGFSIQGKILEGGEVTLGHETSSQFASALMMVGACMRQGLQVKFKKTPVSFPYLQMSANLMQDFELRVKLNEKSFRVWPAGLSPGTFPFPYSAEPDWSSAAFFYTALLLHPELKEMFLEELDIHSLQADAEALRIFESLGIKSIKEKNGIRIVKTDERRVQEFYDLRNCPDLFPPLALALAQTGLNTHITGIEHLSVKESNRGAAMEDALWQLGYHVKFDGKMFSFYPHPAAAKKEAHLDIQHDHRLCMAYALLPMLCPETHIQLNGEPDACTKSFPDFFQQVEKMGIGIKS